MWESQVVREWQEEARRKALVEGHQEGLREGRQEGRQEGLREGQLEGQRSALLKVLRARFQTQLPEDLAQAIQQATDPEVLSRWLDTALTAPSLEVFRSLVQAAPDSPPGSGTRRVLRGPPDQGVE
jgi:flagellar biosynthesis/type III secretory pathway protein FliH